MTEMVLRSRIAVLVVATLLSVSGVSASTAFLATDSAEAAPNYTCLTYMGKTMCQPIYR